MPPGQCVNSMFYCLVLRWLWKDIALWKDYNLAVHHDNTPSRGSFVTSSLLTKISTTVVSHPPYSPDLASCNQSVSKIETSVKRMPFQHLCGNLDKIAGSVRRFHRSRLSNSFQGVEKTPRTGVYFWVGTTLKETASRMCKGMCLFRDNTSLRNFWIAPHSYIRPVSHYSYASYVFKKYGFLRRYSHYSYIRSPT